MKRMTVSKLSRTFIILFLFLGMQVTAFGQEKDTVCITRTGAKYHRETCHYLKYSSFKVSLKEATTRGYTPCSVCKPGTLRRATGATSESTPQRLHNSSGQNLTTRQCSAYTQAGNRCKRNTTNANGKCWQHQ